MKAEPAPSSLREAVKLLEELVDQSDPDISSPQLAHLLQTGGTPLLPPPPLPVVVGFLLCTWGIA